MADMQPRPQFHLFTIFCLTAIAAIWCFLARRHALVAGEGLLFDEAHWMHGLETGAGGLIGMALGFNVMVFRIYRHYASRVD